MTEAVTVVGPAVAPKGPRQFQGLFDVIPFTVFIDENSIADQAASAGNITVAGAELGDFVLVAPIVDTGDLLITATVTAADTVTVVFGNLTAGAVTAISASPKMNGIVLKPKANVYAEL